MGQFSRPIRREETIEMPAQSANQTRSERKIQSSPASQSERSEGESNQVSQSDAQRRDSPVKPANQTRRDSYPRGAILCVSITKKRRQRPRTNRIPGQKSTRFSTVPICYSGMQLITIFSRVCLVKRLLWGYPGTYPSMTTTIRFNNRRVPQGTYPTERTLVTIHRDNQGGE